MSAVTLFSVTRKASTQEFEQMFREHYPLVYRTAFSVTGSSEDAEDVVQTIFLRLLGRESPPDLKRNPKGYLYRAALNLSLNTLRLKKRQILIGDNEIFDRAVYSSDASPQEEMDARLWEAIGELNPGAAEMLVLRYVHGSSLGSIAKLLGTTRSTVAVSLFRSRNRLKKMIHTQGSAVMKNQEKNAGKILDQFFARIPKPSQDQMEDSRIRILGRLQREAGELSLDLGSAPAPARSNWKIWGSVLAGAAAAIAIIVFLLIPQKPGAYVTLETGQQIAYGEIIHSSADAGEVVMLADGSRVEMRAGSEISLKSVADGLQIRLNSGSVIVNAAKQGSGHLYVQTRDCVVSVVGTVFLVTADVTGSRVAVIQGEVHVQQGTTLKALLPGEQLSTASSMKALPVGEAISWSRFAESHLELLKRSVNVPEAALGEHGVKPVPDSAVEKGDAPPALIASASPPILVPTPTSPTEVPARTPLPDVVRVLPKPVLPDVVVDNRPLNTLKVNVEMVQVYTTVTDAAGRFVTNLKSGNFKISEDSKDEQIEAFSSDDSPLSVGFLFDVNGLMGDNLPAAKEAALSFLKAGNFANEYFLLEFNDKPTLAVDYTSDLSRLRNHTPVLGRSKESGALDAIYAGLEKLRSAKNPRRVLFVFTTGGNLKNEHKASQVRTLAAQLDVQIYGLSIADGNDHGDTDGGTGMEVIDSVGGEVFVPDNGPDFLTTARKIAVALRNQYILSYKSTNAAHDGKYRRLKVKLAIDNAPDLFVHTRGGYYASGPER